MSQSPTRTPLEEAKARQLRITGDTAGVTPRELAAVVNCLPPGKYKFVDRVDARNGSQAEHLGDKGTDAILARAAAVKDTFEPSPQTKQSLRRYHFNKGAHARAETIRQAFIARAEEIAERHGYANPGLKAEAVYQGVLGAFSTDEIVVALMDAYGEAMLHAQQFRADMDQDDAERRVAALVPRHCSGCTDPHCAYCEKLRAEARQDRDGDAPEQEEPEPWDDATGPMGGGR